MQVYDIQISGALDVERINAQGDYIYYSYGSAGGSSPCVEVRGINTGFRVKLMPGQGMRLPMGRVERDWLIKPDASIAGSLIGAVVIGEGEIFDNRVTGSVEVVDGGKNRTIGRTAFMVGGSKTGVGGQYAFMQLWNPIGSGKNIVVEGMAVGSSTAGGLWIFGEAIERATLLAVPTSKMIGSGAISVGKLKSENSVTAPIGPMFPIVVAANGTQQIKFNEPIVVQPGTAITTMHTAFGADVLSTFEMFEEPV